MNWLRDFISNPTAVITAVATLLLVVILLDAYRRKTSSRGSWRNSNIRPHRTATNPPRPLATEMDIPPVAQLNLHQTMDHKVNRPWGGQYGVKNPHEEKND